MYVYTFLVTASIIYKVMGVEGNLPAGRPFDVKKVKDDF